MNEKRADVLVGLKHPLVGEVIKDSFVMFDLVVVVSAIVAAVTVEVAIVAD
ncbi:10842_t:CDS:2, partial [Entrophospora sp. SA101]